MAKIPFTKFKCKLNEEIKTLEIKEGLIIEVKQYLPIQDKLSLIGRVIEQAHEQDYNYSNPVKADVYAALEIIYSYTNISFTEKQKEEPAKLYDLLVSSKIIPMVYNSIPAEEIDLITTGIDKSIESVYKYQNSVVGILETIKQDYNDLDLEATNISEKLTNPENLDLVKDILTKLG